MENEETDDKKIEPIQGRSVFVIETVDAGIAVQTSFLTEDGRLLQMPAVFPDVEYAIAQIDELRHQVAQHFSKAALVGAKIIANEAINKSSRELLDQESPVI